MLNRIRSLVLIEFSRFEGYFLCGKSEVVIKIEHFEFLGLGNNIKYGTAEGDFSYHEVEYHQNWIKDLYKAIKMKHPNWTVKTKSGNSLYKGNYMEDSVKKRNIMTTSR